VIVWHRQIFYFYWRWLSRRKSVGRPTVSPEVKVLIKQMAQSNPLWGAPQIHGELQKPGIEISERTVSRLIPKRRKPPSQTWRTFLDNHLGDIVGIDFFTVSTASFRVLFVLVILAHHRRRIVHFNVTANPTAAWTAQQMVEAFPEESASRFLLRDRDQICGRTFGEPQSSRARLCDLTFSLIVHLLEKIGFIDYPWATFLSVIKNYFATAKIIFERMAI
jgi:putative transposase